MDAHGNKIIMANRCPTQADIDRVTQNLRDILQARKINTDGIQIAIHHEQIGTDGISAVWASATI